MTWDRQLQIKLATVVSLFTVLAAAGVWLAQVSDSVVTGGPVVILGIDAEDGGLGAHGPVTAYSNLMTSMLGQVGNGGAGILVIGGGKFPSPPNAFQDEVTDFWAAVDTNLLTTGMAYVNGAANITAASFTGFAMLAIVSSEAESPSGGLTADENAALIGRAGDIAEFVNNGGGLIGLTQSGLDDPYLYLGNIASILGNQGLDFSDITPLPEGTAVGITDELDVCCWHDDFTEFPEFLNVLATSEEGNAVALGGSQVIITTSTTTSTTPSTVAPTTVVPTTAPPATVGPGSSTTLVVPTTRPQTATTRLAVATTVRPATTTTTVRRTSPTTAVATPARARLTG